MARPWLTRWPAATLVVLLIAALAGAGWLRLTGGKLLGVQTASMVPVFRPGDALVVVPVAMASLKPGDIVSYHSPRNPNVTITHRLVSVDPKTGWLTTAGDAYQTTDPSFPPSLVIGQARAVLPGLGKVLSWPRRPLGLATFIYIPALFTVALEVAALSRGYARPIYSVRL